ncbi:MAG: hypothetical protein KAG98_04535 [Lentisphaeria bacterium]|nr:hypothetical protein [Lentisphaeria bacterium]
MSIALETLVKFKLLPLLCLAMGCLGNSLSAASTQDKAIDNYNVTWESPSKDKTGQMPLGNGDIAAGVYAIQDGDLYLLLAKNDAFTYCGDIFKTGKLRVSLKPSPFVKGVKFKQTLDLKTGSIRIVAGDVKLRIWADANKPVYHVQINSKKAIEVSASFESWERFKYCVYNQMDKVDDAKNKTITQDVKIERNGKLLTYYNVGDRSIFKNDLAYYEVPELAKTMADPFRFNIFGNLLESKELKLNNGKLTGSGKQFDIRVHALTKQTPKVENWIKTIEKQVSTVTNVNSDWKNHTRWWSKFWQKSWIHASSNDVAAAERMKLNSEATRGRRVEKDTGALVSQSYNVFRYLMACQSRGKMQAKFNGGLFTQPRYSSAREKINKNKQKNGKWFTHEDSRLWGRRFTFQNQRLLYWPLFMSGDLEMIQPFFNYYSSLLKSRTAITKAWFGHEGAYFRENIEPTGAERDNSKTGKPPRTKAGENKGHGYYHSYYFTCGLEKVTMMIEYVKYSGDQKFSKETLVPFAREVLLFFDKHYGREPNGKLRLDPAMVLETWWIAVNPSNDLAGLQYCLNQLVDMKVGTDADKKRWKRFQSEIPPLNIIGKGKKKYIAPAYEWKKKMNAENGALYAVFPFSLYGMVQGTQDIVTETMKHRVSKNSFGYKCWTQDQIDWAYAGNAKEASNGLVHRFRHASTQVRFPLYGSAGPDSCPDLDHFGSGSVALQRMLVQEGNGKIILLPAWPSKWDVDFKLHLSRKTTIQGTVKNGKLVKWSISPTSRKKDVVIMKPKAI